MYTVQLTVTRTDTWHPTVTIPEEDRQRYAHMSDDEAIEYIMQLVDGDDAVLDEMRHKDTLDTDLDVAIEGID